MTEQKTITVLGAGYVGLTSAVLFAHAGYKVHLIEPNADRLKIIKQGRSFFFEEGIDDLIKPVVDDGRLVPTTSYADSVPESDFIFSCVGTPDNADGSSNLTYVFGAAEEAAKHAKKGSVYIQKSTVPVGTGENIEKRFEKLNANVAYVSNPEFLREGTAISDTLYFDRVVAGGRDSKSVEEVLDIYRTLEEHRDEIAAIAGVPQVIQTGDYIATSLNSAELIKVTANAFLALKISFANSIAKLADRADADINEVMNAVGSDKRIGRAFLNAGRGYGGGCFPKDVSGLISSGLSYGVDLDIMQAAQNVNNSMPGYIIEKLKDQLGDLAGKKVAVLGLAFKAGTSDVRRSPGVAMANALANQNVNVTAYDPEANHEAAEDLIPGTQIVDSLNEALEGAEAIIVATDWPEFVTMGANEFKVKSARVFVDAMNRFNPAAIREAGFTYIGVGRS